jgi:hypothetical protein
MARWPGTDITFVSGQDPRAQREADFSTHLSPSGGLSLRIAWPRSRLGSRVACP